MRRELSFCTLGMPYFDAQHQRLAALLCELESSVLLTPRAVREVLLKLMNFAEVHFYAEESLMASMGFPRQEEHRREHRKIASRLNAFKAELESGNNQNGEQLIGFIAEWIEQHVRKFDLGYAQFYYATNAAAIGRDADASTRHPQPDQALPS